MHMCSTRKIGEMPAIKSGRNGVSYMEGQPAFATAGIQELSFTELDMVAAGINWGAVGNQALGGAIAGGIGGAIGGAVTGTMVGGIGAGPGAVAGGIGGAIAGGIGGAAMEIWNQVSK